MRQRLESERRRYLELFELAPDAYLVTDANGRILEASRAAATLFGVEARLLVGQRLGGFVPAGERKAFRSQLLDLEHAIEPQTIGLSLVSRSGRPFPASATVGVGYDANGAPEALRWIVRDMTAERESEEEIRTLNAELERRVAERTEEVAAASRAHEEERVRLRRLLDRLREGVIAVDRDLYVEFANGEAQRILSPAKLREGTPLPEPWEEFSLHDFACDLFEPGAKTRELRVALDERQILSLVGIPPEHAGGAMLVLVDVSEQERLELVEREFVSNAAHELRTPLAGITSAIDVLQSGAKEIPEERDRFLEHIERECKRLSRFVHALLLLARVQRGEQVPKLQLVELRPLLEEAAAGLTPRRGVELEVRCPRDAAALVNRELLLQALASIGANAVKYTSEGKIVLSARRAGAGRVALEIRDTGPGIPTGEHGLVLKRFYRVNLSDGDGFGLGLAIAAEAVRAIGGELELDSAPGAGTVARMIVPAAELIRA
jgi:PAS domain S-box-containing protein